MNFETDEFIPLPERDVEYFRARIQSSRQPALIKSRRSDPSILARMVLLVKWSSLAWYHSYARVATLRVSELMKAINYICCALVASRGNISATMRA